MMNFMSGRPGFYEDISMSSSSSSSIHQQKGPLSPHTYTLQQEIGGNSQAPDSNVRGEDDLHMFLGGEGGSATAVVVEKEHMFDKVVTPSDVGKLNRLVIPKQHAEKYFPLDSSSNEKGLMLNFEDRNGKPWRFRYSYWNSSQSYVMTKGWSRFVKEKKLDAGDIVSFQRGLGELVKDRLFIDWRRRPDAPPQHLISPHQQYFSSSWNPLFLQPAPSRRVDYSQLMMHNHSQYHHNHINNGYALPNYAYGSSRVVNGNPCPPGSIVYLRGGGSFSQQQQMVYESVPVVQGKAAAKRLRLFGVNMDCPIPVDDADESCLPIQFHQQLPPASPFSTSPTSSSSLSDSRHYLRPNYNNHSTEEKGKGSMSLDLDI